jgi:plasmid stability protein
MKSLTIRNIPDDLYKIIVNMAKTNHRSIQQQVLFIIERARMFSYRSPVEKAKDIRQRLQGRELGDTIKEIEEERSR